MSKNWALLVLLVANVCFSQKFIPLDAETLEFVTDVNYRLFFGGEDVFSGVCDNDRATEIPREASFDSIVLVKMGYEPANVRKADLQPTICLTKQTIFLEELVLVKTPGKDLLLGEKNKFFDRRNCEIPPDLRHAVWFENYFENQVDIKSFRFFVEKVKYDTTCKVVFYRFDQSRTPLEFQPADEVLYTSDTIRLKPGFKGEVSVSIDSARLPLAGLLASVQLIGYADENQNSVSPKSDARTRMRFRFSRSADYFNRVIDSHTGIESAGLININARINYDFAFQFFKKPDKSTLVSPAYFLEVSP